MKIWLLTWNTEIMAANTGNTGLDLNGMINAAGVNAPDLIITAQQEAIGPFIEDVPLTGYGKVTSSDIKGKTKGTCHTHLGVMVKNPMTVNTTPSNVKFYAYEGGYGKGLKTVGTNLSTGGLNVKGGAMAELTIGGKTIGICSAHLDADGGSPKTKQIDRTLASLFLGRKINSSEHANAPTIAAGLMNARNALPRYDAVFYLGDLNYRIGTVTEPTNDVVTQLSAANIKTILTGGNVSGIDLARLKSFDLNPHSSLATTYGFTLPHYDTRDFPTYKLNYKADDGNNGTLTNGKADVQSSLDKIFRFVRGGTRPRQALPGDFDKVYLNHLGNKIWNTKRGVYDMGWLDRVGYKTRTGTTVTVSEYGPIPFVLSDHLPVLMKVDLA